MRLTLTSLRQDQTHAILNITARGECCAVFGLSNSGKSPLLRALPHPDNQAVFAQAGGRPGALIYVDCNRAVELSSQGFYEIVVRALLEGLEDLADASPIDRELLAQLREHHSQITSAPSAFQASLAFNTALADTCSQLAHSLVLLFDEFDEVYAALENRALLNLRALKDKFRSRLAYVTATVRPLNESRVPGDNEFAELFTAHSLPLGMLSPADARRALDLLDGRDLPPEVIRAVLDLAGGHFGLVAALTQAARRGAATAEAMMAIPNARIECLKLWNQLRAEEQEALKLLVAEGAEGLPRPTRERLRQLGLITADGEFFSDLYAAFVRRQSAPPAQRAPGVTVDEDAGEVWVDGVKVSVLTDLEYRLMRLLYSRPDRLTTKEMIVEAVWGGQYYDNVDDTRIEKLVSRLRAKVEPDPARPRYILTQRGRGYRLSSRPVETGSSDDEGA